MPYSDKLSVQCLGELLKKYQIEDIVCSPGSRNGALMMHFSALQELNTYSIVDERSAGFFALGIAQQTRKPVAVCCTSGSAVVNYYPAVTEAFYQNIPLVVISADRPLHLIDQFDGQTIRQHQIFEKHSYANITIEESENISVIEQKLEESLAICIKKQGPIHINLSFKEPLYNKTNDIFYKNDKSYSVKENNPFLKNELLELAEIWNQSKRKMVLVGMQFPNEELSRLLEILGQDDSVVIFTENISNVHGNRFFPFIDRLIYLMKDEDFELLKPDLLLTIGQNVVSKKIKSLLRKNPPKKHWHLDPYWHPDTFGCLSQKINSNPIDFLTEFSKKIISQKADYYTNWKVISDKRERKHKDFLSSTPFCDLKVFERIIEAIPKDYSIQYGNSSVIRYAQLFENKYQNKVFSNRGTSGIDGCSSTAMGAAFATKEPTLLVSGDLSFLYDSNALWNNYISNKIRIIVINNGGGNIFKFIEGPRQSSVLEKHFEHKHFLKMELLAKMFGFSYINVSNELELKEVLPTFFASADEPKILEIDTSLEDNAQILQNYFKEIHQT